MGFEPSQQDVRRNLEENVRHEEDGKSDIGLITHKVQVFRELQSQSITNVDADNM